MATTATISSSTTLPVVGRSTMNLVGASTPPTTPPATPTSPILGASDPAKTYGEADSMSKSTALLDSSAKVQQATMEATPPPSPPPAPISSTLLPMTPFPMDLDSEALPLTATITTTAKLDSSAGHSLSSTVAALASAAALASGSGPVSGPVSIITPAATTAAAATTTTTTTLASTVTAASQASAPIPSGEATTFFDDVINAPKPPANILTLSPTTSLPDVYHDFFDNHPELYYDSDQSSSEDPEMMEDMMMQSLLDDPEGLSPATAAVMRARTMTDLRHTTGTAIQVPLIADRPKLETIDTINLMIHHQDGSNGGRQVMGMHHHHHPSGQVSSDDCSASNQGPNRKKKASRACFHCQKAHLTCDDSRPCQRCVKRDLSGSCTDGVRKKAKYLQDAIDSQQRAAEQARLEQQDSQTKSSPLNDAHALFSFPHVPSSSSSTTSTLSSLTSAAAAKVISPLSSTSASTFSSSSSKPTSVVPDHGFGSEAINLEYTILSTMLSSPTAELQSMTSELSMVDTWQRQGALEAMANSLQHQHQHQGHLQRSSLAQHYQQLNGHGNNIGSSHGNGKGIFGNNNVNSSNSNANGTTSAGAARVSKRKHPSNTPENVYANTKQPFNYTDGFHYLLRYVRERMDKEEMMRVCRAMAMFRPSFIALIMNLTPEDLIFMETCFQRTVLEFEKLISFSGTPTVVWRRTGEIALVGKEFSLLTQWSRDQLQNKKTYIYELMDNQSAVEYWEKFSTHAFENTEQTVMTTCILLSPTNRVVPCTFCFTIKRDIFDIPLAIVGNFLPILS